MITVKCPKCGLTFLTNHADVYKCPKCKTEFTMKIVKGKKVFEVKK